MSVGDARLDAFASMFRSAVHERFTLAPPRVERVLLVSDLDPERTGAALDVARRLLAGIDSAGALEWAVLDRAAWASGDRPIVTLLDRIDAIEPDLVVTWRQLLGAVRDLPWTLGSVVDTLTQARDAPVLLLPDPDDDAGLARIDGTRRVLVVTDHLTGDDRLVNVGVHFTASDGTLYLAHVEDALTLQRFLDVIDKLPELNSDVAREVLPAKLLALPTDYIASVADALRSAGIPETVQAIVRMGSALDDYRALIDAHDLDLLVLESNDERQAAMHPMAHALAVELRDRPLLLL